MPDEQWHEIGLRSGSNIDYKLLLLFHLNRLSELSVFVPKMFMEGKSNLTVDDLIKLASEGFHLGTRLMDSFLKPYIDKEYKEDIAAIEAKYAGKLRTEVDPRDICIEKLAAIMNLMCRKNLLLEETMVMEF
jgi:hypothetical protein